MATLNLIHLNGTPAYTIETTDPNYSRVYGGVYDKKNVRWLFPAYPPFGLVVLDDLSRVDKQMTFSTSVLEHRAYLDTVPQRIRDCELPAGFTFHTAPFDHQKQMLAKLLHFPRFAIFWEPGCGKSKVPIDHLRATPGQTLLILSQKVTLENWVEQVAIHSGGSLRAVALLGSAADKHALIKRWREFDVIIASYGTARTMGLPQAHKKTIEALDALQAKGRTLPQSSAVRLIKSVSKLSDTGEQLRYLQMWADGTSLIDVERAVDKHAASSAQWLEDIGYQRCLVDESQNIKELSSQQTKAILELGKKASHRYVMSGTPTMGDPRHLYPQMKFLSPAIFPEDWFKFSDMFLVRSPYNKRIVTGYKNLNIINSRVSKISDTKKKEDCLDLPERVTIDIPVTLTKEQTRLYNSLISAMGVDLGSFFDGTASGELQVQNAATLLNKLGQVSSGFLIGGADPVTQCNGCPHLTNCVSSGVLPFTPACVVAPEPPQTSSVNYLKESPKLDALDELLDTILEDPGHKVIVWAYYRAELDQIQELLEKRDLAHVRIDGSSSGSLQKKITRFNNDPDCRVYLGQVGTGVGITLNAASYMVYFCLDWSLGTYLQSIDRNYRAGQTKKVTVYRLLAKNTVEEYKARALDQKKDLSERMTGRLACVSCKNRDECLKNGIELFDTGCLYKKNARRVIARAEVINESNS